MKRILKRLAKAAGYDISRRVADEDSAKSKHGDFSRDVLATIEQVRPFTMTSPERIAGLCDAAEYVVQAGIPGDFVECGVWRGGSAMAAALTFLRLDRPDIRLCLFDTFTGMTEPTDHDRDARTGEAALVRFQEVVRDNLGWCEASQEDVSANLARTGYPAQHIRLIAGKVEDTIPAYAPKEIALLRLDTDWYASTRHEMEHLFPRLSRGGILIIDDYGHWEGARMAVDEYFAANSIRMMLNRLDYTGRIGVKL